MKKISIENKIAKKKMTFQCCEGVEDINAKRWNEVKKQLARIESGLDIPTLKEMFKKYTLAFDKGNHGASYRVIADFLFSLEQVEKNNDPDQMIFALMTLEDGEDPATVDATKLKDKIERMCAAGLTQGCIREEVENFIEGLITR